MSYVQDIPIEPKFATADLRGIAQLQADLVRMLSVEIVVNLLVMGS